MRVKWPSNADSEVAELARLHRGARGGLWLLLERDRDAWGVIPDIELGLPTQLVACRIGELNNPVPIRLARRVHAGVRVAHADSCTVMAGARIVLPVAGTAVGAVSPAYFR